VYASGFPEKFGKVVMSFNYSVMIYLLGAIATSFVIAIGLIRLAQMTSKNRKFRIENIRLVISSKKISPYSFFNYIFIGKDLMEQDHWKSIVHHEMEHVRQGHSFDVLFVDFMMIFQWFNPFYWIIRRMVRENHEFLADTGVLSKGLISNGQYKTLLLSQAIGGNLVFTSNFFTIKTIKKRFKMITKQNNRKLGFLKYISGVVIAVALTLLFACEKSSDLVYSSTFDGNIIYNGVVITTDELLDLNISNIQMVKGDRLDVLTVYPDLKSEISDIDYTMVFNADDPIQMEKAAVLNVDVLDSTSNELVVVAYGSDTSLDDDDEVFTIVEDMPEFPGGELALRKYIAQSIKYPEEAIAKKIEGKVYVTFVVEKDGSVGSVRIARGVASSLDNEALRVVTELPKWKPGTQRGQAVRVNYTVPINFMLQ
jgi:TonB family protein